MKVLAYLALLGLLAGLVRALPMLWEIGLLGAIGGAWWLFFREPPRQP